MTTRILHVLSSLDPLGAAAQAACLAAGLPHADFDVHLCALDPSPRPGDPRPSGAAPVGLTGHRSAPDPAVVVRLCRHVKRLQPDVVHAWHPRAGFCGRVAALVVANSPCVVRCEPEVRPRQSLSARALDRLLGTRAQRIVVTCNELRQTYIQCGVPDDRLAVIPWAVPESCQNRLPRPQVRHELGLPVDARLIGAASPLVPSNRCKDLIWSADLLKVLYDNVHLIIIGDGPQRWRLQRYCRQLRIEDRVHLLGDRQDARWLISGLDLFWAAGPEATQAGPILAAMAAAVPVLAADTPATRDLIVSEKTGVLFPVGNRAMLARRTSALLVDPAHARQLGEAGQLAARAQFSVDRMLQRYASLYNELLHR